MDLDIKVDIMKNYNKMKVINERNKKLDIIKSQYIANKINLLKHTLAKSSKIKEEVKEEVLEQSNEINVAKNKYTIHKKGLIITKGLII